VDHAGDAVMLGGLWGLVLAYAGTRFVRAGYPLYGQMISGGGIAMLYVSTYGAYNYYQLISQPMAFALMCGVTVVGALLADRQQSQGLALMSVGGGFATPFLLPVDASALAALFSYDAIIVAGTLYLAGRRDWPFLNLLSYVGVCLTLAARADELLVPARYLSTEIVLTVFCAMFLYVLRVTRHSKSELAEAVRTILWTAPAGYYVSSLVVLNDHSAALLVFLLLLSLVGAVSAHANRSSGVRATFWVATAVPLGGWILQHAGHEWLMPGLVTVVAVYALTLISQFVAAAEDDGPWSNADIGLAHGNALFTALAAYVLVDAVRSDLTAPVIAGFALWHGVLSLASARRDRRVALHFAALAFTMLAAATSLQFHGAALTAAWAAEGCAVIWLGLREQRGWLRLAGAMGFMVAVGRLGVLLTDPPLAGHHVLLNERAACGLFIIALTYGLAWIHHRRHANDAVAFALVTAKLLILGRRVLGNRGLLGDASAGGIRQDVGVHRRLHAGRRRHRLDGSRTTRRGRPACRRPGLRGSGASAADPAVRGRTLGLPRGLQRAGGGRPSRDRDAVRSRRPPQAARRARENARAADWCLLHRRQPAFAVDAHIRDQRLLAARLVVGDGDHVGAGDARRRVDMGWHVAGVAGGRPPRGLDALHRQRRAARRGADACGAELTRRAGRLPGDGQRSSGCDGSPRRGAVLAVGARAT
jgi:uncharacterized membrane protein